MSTRIILSVIALVALGTAILCLARMEGRPAHSIPLDDAARTSGPLQQSGDQEAVDPLKTSGEERLIHTPETLGPEVNPSADRVSELAALLKSSPKWSELKGYLKELVDIGTPESLSVVVQHMQEGPHHTHEPSFLSELLKNVDDPRIPVAAAAALRECVLKGHDTWDVVPYADIMLEHGSDAERQELVDLLRREDMNAQLRNGLGASLTNYRDIKWGESLLDVAVERIRLGDASVGSSLLHGLAKWDDPKLRSLIVELARDTNLDETSRRQTYSAWGSSLATVAGIGEVVNEYRSAQGADRAMIFYALSGAISGIASDMRPASMHAALPMLQDGLLSNDHAARLSALSFIGDNLEDMPIEIANSLRMIQGETYSDPKTSDRILTYARAIENRRG